MLNPFATGRRVRRGMGLLMGTLVLIPTAGCYATLPLATDVPAGGRKVQIEINDRGRVALGSQLGPGVRFVEGRLSAATDSDYTVAVSAIVGFDNVPQSWSGENLRLDRNFVRVAAERRLDPVKTSLVAGGALAVVVGFFATRSLLGSGSGGSGGQQPPVAGQ